MPLILSRKIGETILIGDDIIITVQSLRDSSGTKVWPALEVQIEISAPASVQIDRKERRDRRGQD